MRPAEQDLKSPGIGRDIKKRITVATTSTIYLGKEYCLDLYIGGVDLRIYRYDSTGKGAYERLALHTFTGLINALTHIKREYDNEILIRLVDNLLFYFNDVNHMALVEFRLRRMAMQVEKYSDIEDVLNMLKESELQGDNFVMK